MDAFAEQVGGSSYKTWGGSNWREGFFNVMEDKANTIHFNLTGPDGEMINAWKAIQDTSKATNWELQQLYMNPEWQSRATFYFHDGTSLKAVANPWGG